MATLFTIGHSTLELARFIQILASNEVKLLVDVRTVPRSRRNFQFNRESLPEALAAAGIAYRHEPRLGGLRHPRKDSPNGAWRNDSFRGFADYMQTADFASALDELIAGAETARTAIMCAEALPWRCHRSLIADALSARGVEVRHLFAAGGAREHRTTSFAHRDGTTITYPAAEAAT